jgi:hypothetical protein
MMYPADSQMEVARVMKGFAVVDVTETEVRQELPSHPSVATALASWHLDTADAPELGDWGHLL